jgi:thiamine biosynthesis lipoprotein
MMKKLILLLLPLLLLSCNQTAPQKEYIHNTGKIYGTFYNIVYHHPEGKDLHKDIQQLFGEFDLSLSTFNPNSVISRINQNADSVVVDQHFTDMYQMANYVSELSNGAFDITVAPLVNAWGFGFGKKEQGEEPNVIELLNYTGFHKISLQDGRLIKSDPRIMLDASAIAKGQASDVVARLLEKNGCSNYMVEIGGEVMCKGKNARGIPWQIGVDKPDDDPANEEHELQIIVGISGVGLATSGNYRQFYYRDGKKYAHTINPRTGYPVDHNLLSATVIAPTCMQADAFATAFMVLGVDSSLVLCDQVPNMECYLIYADDLGNYQVKYTDGFKKYITE